MLSGRLAVVAASLVLLSACSPPAPADPAELAREMFDLSNQERVEAGLDPIEWSDCLARKAEARAEPFATDPNLVHDVLFASCHEGVKAGENLSRTDLDAAGVVELWMGSAGHRANIVDPEFRSGAIACVVVPADADGGDSGVRACSQLFEG